MGGSLKSNVKQFLLDYVTTHGAFTIPLIAEQSGLSSTCIVNYVTQMLNDGLIEVANHTSTAGTKGRRAIQYVLKGDSAYFIGVDVNFHELNVGVMSFSGEMVKKYCDEGFRFENTFGCLDTICSIVVKAIEETESKIAGAVKYVCFSLSGRVDSRHGTSSSIFNFEDFQYTSLSVVLGEKLGRPVVVENDTKTKAYGEYTSLYKDKCKDFLFVNMSWGIGLGIILNGELFSGSNGYSGEIGHIKTYDNNILCHCGKKGCVETEVSLRAICRKITERICQKGELCTLSNKVNRGVDLTPADVIEAAKHEDPLCIEVLSGTAHELGRHLAGMLNIFNPETIVIGGKITNVASYYFFQQAAVSIMQNSLMLMGRGVSIRQSELGDDAGIVGACLLARNKYIEGLYYEK